MLNYIGQIRIYSLIDLIILLIAIKAGLFQFVGVIFLHIGFLIYLESRHQHSNRKKFPKYLWIILFIIGLCFYKHIEWLLFIIFSYLYALKNKGYFASFSPVMRGFQYFILVAGIIGYENKIIWLVLILLTIRNFCGDLRDVVKDTKEGMKTLPILIGFKHDIKYLHLGFLLVTTFVWFRHTDLNLLIIIPIFLIQIFTYRLTPR